MLARCWRNTLTSSSSVRLPPISTQRPHYHRLRCSPTVKKFVLSHLWQSNLSNLPGTASRVYSIAEAGISLDIGPEAVEKKEVAARD